MPKDRLYVTYFGGCPERGLGPDLEAKEIWMKVGCVLCQNLLF
jgi:alanyl-tRNA synthetase